MRIPVFVLLFITPLFINCAAKKIGDVTYINAAQPNAPKLNIFVPGHPKQKKLPVLIFVHGGNWNSGNKDTYGFFGRNFAKKGVITIIPDYTLSPAANSDVMAKQIAEAIQWTKNNISRYNGDPAHIFITGHSAGGQLAAIAVMNPKYGIAKGTIAGIILNDAAGLDMKNYLEENPPTDVNDYITTWTNDPARWQDASPIYFLDKNMPPFLIYVGDKTYSSIKTANERFLKAVHAYQPTVVPLHINKSHVPMVLQYFWPWSDRFGEVISFMELH